VVSCQNANEISGSVKHEKIFNQLSDYQFLKKGSVPHRYVKIPMLSSYFMSHLALFNNPICSWVLPV
jgi:hypothetical protein